MLQSLSLSELIDVDYHKLTLLQRLNLLWRDVLLEERYLFEYCSLCFVVLALRTLEEQLCVLSVEVPYLSILYSFCIVMRNFSLVVRSVRERIYVWCFTFSKLHAHLIQLVRCKRLVFYLVHFLDGVVNFRDFVKTGIFIFIKDHLSKFFT